MSPDSEGQGAAVEAGVGGGGGGRGANLTQPSGSSCFSLYTVFSEVLASVILLGRYALLKIV